MKNWISAVLVTAFALVACSESPPPHEDVEPRQPEVAPKSVDIEAPAGMYHLDPHHSSLHFSVDHLGLSHYVMRFTDFDVTVDLDPEDLSASSVQVTIDAASVKTDYDGDYEGTHPDSPFDSWNEDLAKNPEFLNADEYPTITFESTSVNPTDRGTLEIVGDLQLRGETRPVTLEAELVGSMAQHPMAGVGAMGFSARGSFERSEFGMTHLLTPPIIGDTVTLRFDGELLQEQQAEEEQPQEEQAGGSTDED